MPMSARANSLRCCDFIVLQCARDIPPLAFARYLDRKCLDFLVICKFHYVHLMAMSFIKISIKVRLVLQHLPWLSPQILQFLQ